MGTLVRWRPWDEVTRNNLAMANRLRHMAEQTAYDGGSQVYRLPVDVYSTDDEIVITAAVPGLEPEDIQINLEDDVLTIEGELKREGEEEVDYLIRERAAEGRFHRSLRLNIPVEVENIEAVFNNGVLALTLPKAPEAKPLNIPIKIAKK